MSKIKKLTPLWIVISLAAPIFLSAGKTAGEEQFETSYDIFYIIDKNGQTTVTQKIKIENKAEDILATTYSITVNQMEIFDVSGKDTAGPLDINVKQDQEKNSIVLSAPLNEKVIGKGRSNELEITYKTDDLANKVGSIWNINLPKTANLDKVKNYKARVQVPLEFGPNIFISPEPDETSEQGLYRTYYYSKDRLEGKGISAAFGSNQVFNFKLDYHLKNDNFLPVKQEISLPPDIKNQQQIYYEALTPRPKKIYKDKDGNIMAIYRLKPGQDLKISLQGAARIFGRQINPQFGGQMLELPKDLVDSYTKEDTYWEINSPKIKELANKLFDPHKNVTENAQKAYEYITSHLEYNYEVVDQTYIERQGALKALTQENPWACMEFTDLFIALTRSMGIPSRELNGYAYSSSENIVPVSIDLKSGDLLHAWPEFYDPNFGWVPVDPTWGTTSDTDYFTKLDTNHLAFVIKGLDSEYPYPAGSYRINSEDEQVNVDFAEDNRAFIPKIEAEPKFTINPWRLLRKEKRVKIDHKEGTILYEINGKEVNLLPFQTKSIYLPKEQLEENYLIYTDFNETSKRISF